MTSPTGSDDLLAEWSRRFAEPVTGWSSREFSGVVETVDPPWSYATLARNALTAAPSALDLGTGGGEFLTGLADVLPADTHATEGWAPNLPVARTALAPLGITVEPHDATRERLPFPDDRFDVVLSRHTAYDADDVSRVLRPGGTFLTQQVDGRNLDDLVSEFGAEPVFQDVTLENAHRAAVSADLHVEVAESWSGPVRFADVSTLVSFLRTVPWHLPTDFTVARYAGVLLALHARAQLQFTERRFLLRVRSSSPRTEAGRPVLDRGPAAAGVPGPRTGS
ncbi:class I SAM-dependent methyltransferase [Kineococcus sp. DHX-1]|uniref:class I SAM-dependent methyltransferase n=1 Tax=Kineococcus sp. DHX-1 TaxID=3349638 RepID=UPI0036D35A78